MENHDQPSNTESKKLAGKPAEYLALIQEAQNEANAQVALSPEAARLYMKAQAVAVAHFHQSGEAVGADAFPGNHPTSERDRV